MLRTWSRDIDKPILISRFKQRYKNLRKNEMIPTAKTLPKKNKSLKSIKGIIKTKSDTPEVQAAAYLLIENQGREEN